MATTGILNGTLMALYIAGTKVANLTTNSMTFNRPTRETSNKDSANWVTKKHKRAMWGFSGSAYFAFDAAYGWSDLYTAMMAGSEVVVMTSTEVVGDEKYYGNALITDLPADFPDDDNSSYNITIEGTGALNVGTVLT